MTERLPDGTTLVLEGVAEVRPSGTALSGTLAGSLYLSSGESCDSHAHGFVLTR